MTPTNSDHKNHRFGTKAIHAGVVPDPSTGAIMTPIYQTSTYVQESPGVHKGYEYARTQNPTRSALETSLAALENGEYAVAFSSGMAAMDSIIRLLQPGDEVISTNDLYGGSYRLLTKVYAKYGIKSHFINLEDAEALKNTINDKTRLIWIETPTNPMLKVIDIKQVLDTVPQEILVVADNTFASPYLQNPLDLGVDMVLHSATKYIGGHSDLVLGAVIMKDPKLEEQLRFLQNAVGAVPGPQDCFLALRGIKTLHLRVAASCQNAKVIAAHLKQHPKIAKVYYPGLEEHPQHEIAKRQMRDFGGMVSFDLHNDDYSKAQKILSGTNIFSLAESLGGVESLIGHPASMTHASIPREERYKVNLTDSLIRLSIGIEDVNDLIDDLDQALESI